jgi:hypothetical protein
MPPDPRLIEDRMGHLPFVIALQVRLHGVGLMEVGRPSAVCAFASRVWQLLMLDRVDTRTEEGSHHVVQLGLGLTQCTWVCNVHQTRGPFPDTAMLLTSLLRSTTS